MPSDEQSEIISAQRALGLLWVILLNFRYRTPGAGEIAVIRDICERLEAGVPRCQEYNEGVRGMIAELRECWNSPDAPAADWKVERLSGEMNRLQLLLGEYGSVVRTGNGAAEPVALSAFRGFR